MTAGRLSVACLLAALALTGGCSQRADNVLEQIVATGIGELLPGEDKPVAPPPPPSRAQLDEVGRPLMTIEFEDVVGTGFIFAVNATRDGYRTYQDTTRRSVVLRGGLVTGMQGFRYDLSWVKTQRNDPVVFQTPVADWPETVARSYRFSLQSNPDFMISVQCKVSPLARETIVIYERTYDVTRIQEECANDRRRFVNTYWAEPDTGFIWKSRQWVGPRLRPATMQVINKHPLSRVSG